MACCASCKCKDSGTLFTPPCGCGATICEKCVRGKVNGPRTANHFGQCKRCTLNHNKLRCPACNDPWIPQRSPWRERVSYMMRDINKHMRKRVYGHNANMNVFVALTVAIACSLVFRHWRGFSISLIEEVLKICVAAMSLSGYTIGIGESIASAMVVFMFVGLPVWLAIPATLLSYAYLIAQIAIHARTQSLSDCVRNRMVFTSVGNDGTVLILRNQFKIPIDNWDDLAGYTVYHRNTVYLCGCAHFYTGPIEHDTRDPCARVMHICRKE